jgi:NAD(P)-dependent dehydrogenase (short-subunit alcohol dehydrogenase family)
MIVQGKAVILSGVGPGLGRKLALLAAAEGAAVALGTLQSEAAFIEGVKNEIEAAGGRAIAVPADVTDPAQCNRLAENTVAAFGTIDGLVNIAYRIGGKTFEEADFDDWRRTHDVIFWGALHMARAVLPAMKTAGGGSIVNVSTQGSVRPLPGQGDYATAKAALNAASRTLARELGKYNIRCNTPRIGRMWGVPFETAYRARAEAAGVPLETMLGNVADGIALGRIPTDDECAKAVLLLLSDYAAVITGAAIDINGGEFMTP